MDRVGLSFRHQLAAGVFAHLESIDVLEVIADDYFELGNLKRRSLRTLGSHRPVLLHGIGMGLASTSPLDRRRAEAMARLYEEVQPESWSEHLAFVRGGGVEIGHLAQPPRNTATVEGTLANLELVTRVVGVKPAMENIATLLEPPGSCMNEAAWLSSIIEQSDVPLLLDLHNIITNAHNTGYEAVAMLDQLPLERVKTVHIAGGRMLPQGRILDDHLHAVPEGVYSLLRELASRVRHPLTVILERDGNYGPFEDLLAELDLARAALRAGRAASVGVA
jgi:uncharacterized protein (UPF0276 family)